MLVHTTVTRTEIWTPLLIVSHPLFSVHKYKLLLSLKTSHTYVSPCYHWTPLFSVLHKFLSDELRSTSLMTSSESSCWGHHCGIWAVTSPTVFPSSFFTRNAPWCSTTSATRSSAIPCLPTAFRNLPQFFPSAVTIVSPGFARYSSLEMEE